MRCFAVEFVTCFFGTSKECESPLNSQMTCLGDNFLNPAFKDENDSEKHSGTDF